MQWVASPWLTDLPTCLAKFEHTDAAQGKNLRGTPTPGFHAPADQELKALCVTLHSVTYEGTKLDDPDTWLLGFRIRF
jgi:hypothetical protein